MFLNVVIAAVCMAASGVGEKQPDYTSRVPKYTFAGTLEEQEAQLKTNPLMLRLLASRKKMAGDRYRPIYHYVNPEGRLNDPNGICRWKGRWHTIQRSSPCQRYNMAL